MSSRSKATRKPEVPVPSMDEPIEFRSYFVAFFDILGQRERLLKMGGIPSTASQQRTFEEGAKATLGAVYEFRRLFNTYFATYLSASPPDFVGKLPSRRRKRVLETCEVDVEFQGFSDTLIVYMPAMNHRGRYQWRGIHAILAACATLMPTLLSVGIPIRGGLALGVGTEFVKGEIYGPVLQEAYRLEATVAGYPRIVVGDRLAEFLHRKTSGPEAAVARGINGDAYDRHTQWLGRDADGIWIVDYLGPSARAMQGDSMDGLIKKAFRFICQQASLFKKVKNEKLAERYRTAKAYYESRCGVILAGCSRRTR